MSIRLQNFCCFSAPLLMSFLLICWLIACSTAYCNAKVNEQTNNILTTEKYYKLEPGTVINDSVQDGSQLIDQMLSAALNLSAYSANYRMKVYKGKQTLNEEGRVYFRKPKLLRLEVIQGSRKGALAILAKDGKIHGHLGGLLRVFSGTVSADSGLAKTINDYPMADTDFYSLAAYLKNMLKQGDLSLKTIDVKQTNKINSLTYILDMYSAAKPTKLLLLKRIYVNPKTYLPMFWEDYIDGKIWSESSWQNVNTNLSLPDNFFRP